MAPVKWRFGEDMKDRILEFDLIGLWTEDDIARFCAEYQERVGAIYRDGPFATLVDMSEYPAQADFTNAGHQNNMNFAIERGLVCSAHIVSSALTDLQMKRLTAEVDSERFAHFQERGSAIRWILAKLAV